MVVSFCCIQTGQPGIDVCDDACWSTRYCCEPESFSCSNSSSRPPLSEFIRLRPCHQRLREQVSIRQPLRCIRRYLLLSPLDVFRKASRAYSNDSEIYPSSFKGVREQDDLGASQRKEASSEVERWPQYSAVSLSTYQLREPKLYRSLVHIEAARLSFLVFFF
jgi:hypothetical protein